MFNEITDRILLRKVGLNFCNLDFISSLLGYNILKTFF